MDVGVVVLEDNHYTIFHGHNQAVAASRGIQQAFGFARMRRKDGVLGQFVQKVRMQGKDVERIGIEDEGRIRHSWR